MIQSTSGFVECRTALNSLILHLAGQKHIVIYEETNKILYTFGFKGEGGD